MYLKPSFIYLVLLSVIFSSFRVKADEGMWILSLLKELKETDLKKAGMELDAEDIYSLSKSSLKDAVVHFGVGCTGEMISAEGLVLTNHHCGYSYIQSHSSVEKDYLTDGYWAGNRAEDLVCKDLTVTFITDIEEVTSVILEGVSDTSSVRDVKVAERIKKLETEANKEGENKVFIRGFFNDNRFFLFRTLTFRDVRLVGTPPSSIGKFGSDTDNWMWPRHTGDFCLFRVYASKDNRPADYAQDNIPYRPKYFLPISLKELKEDDFTMVLGFPGRTQEYLTSYSVDLIRNETDPNRVKVREARLSVLDKQMRSNDTIRIRYAAKYASVSNAWKKWIGEMRGIDRSNIMARKVEEERFLISEHGSESPAGLRMSEILSSIEKTVATMRPVSRKRDFYQEAFLGIEIFAQGTAVANMLLRWEQGKTSREQKEKELKQMVAGWGAFYRNYHRTTDFLVCARILPLFISELSKEEQIEIFGRAYVQDGKLESELEELYRKSFLAYSDLPEIYSKQPDRLIKKLQSDPAVKISMRALSWFNRLVKPTYSKGEGEMIRLQRLWMKSRMEVEKERLFYPDANSTIRLSYGKVKSYKPYDGAVYNWYTTLEGVIEKENPELEEFHVDAKLKTAFLNKDYGSYADANGALRVAFIATNHTTGGNSGSPVLNSKGHFIGINFDRNWEGTMSDIVYDPERVRNIICSAGYILFVIDKVAGAGHLLTEMKILRD